MGTAPLVVITGAGGALGQVLASRFAEQQARLLLVDAVAVAPIQTYSGEHPQPETLTVDLIDATATTAALQSALDRLGPPSVVCAIAGGFAMGPPLHETPDAMWRRMMDLNATTLINTMRCVVPPMIRARDGKIINVAAASAMSGKAGMGPYVAAKNAVARLTESMALELREHRINVNAVAPSILDTPANRSAMPGEDYRRWVPMESLTDVILFLASPAASALNGAVIPVVGLS
jgi:NAD(P)-dependent dehydrogenase (short-subunit alcohol dehydrogenase family)